MSTYYRSSCCEAGRALAEDVEEACAGQSRKDFLAKMSIASKEARETRYWLQLLQQSKIVDIDMTDALREAHEIISILTSIVKTVSEQLK